MSTFLAPYQSNPLDPAGLSLEQRVARLEAYEAIRALKGYYAYVCDAKFDDNHRAIPQADIDAMMKPMVDAVFSEDAEWTTGKGLYTGREAIFKRLRDSDWTFAMHYYMNPIIRIADDGQRATATWMLWEPCTHRDRNEAMWMSALTDDEYVLTAEGWRISKYTYRAKFLTPFDKPWTKPGAPAAAGAKPA